MIPDQDASNADFNGMVSVPRIIQNTISNTGVVSGGRRAHTGTVNLNAVAALVRSDETIRRRIIVGSLQRNWHGAIDSDDVYLLPASN